MDLQTFLSSLVTLQNLPSDERERIAIMAEGLSDADRQAFLAELQAWNEQMQPAAAAREEAVQKLENMVTSFDAVVTRAGREEAESAEHTKEVSTAEQKLSSQF